MKLVTLIPPRRDGTVIVREGADTFVFTPDERGDLVCDVPIVGGLAARLLAGGMFEPADADDHESAARLLGVEGDEANMEGPPEDAAATAPETPVKRRPGRPRRERPPQ